MAYNEEKDLFRQKGGADMIDLLKLNMYKENNRIEAKKALGGLPKSIWETYSSFANTLGGIILLGVIEEKDKSLHSINLPDPEKLVREFWEIVNDPKRTSVNILAEHHVTIEEVEGNRIIVIKVPRAQRYDKPVFLDGSLYQTYRRTGEGDYRCSREEVSAMLRDAGVKTQDMTVLDGMGTEVLEADTVHRYRKRMEKLRPGHVWEKLDDLEFLYRLGAVGRSRDGKMHPTGAGLLMFGKEKEIVKEYPYYFLDYQEQMDQDTRCTQRIISSSGEWTGNVYDFYCRVYEKIAEGIHVPLKIDRKKEGENTPVHEALREALLNCLTNADYYGRQGLVIVKKREAITLSNPGGFRMDVEEAKSGGFSDSRNGAMAKMFNVVDIGESEGGGIPNIYRVWRKQGWKIPVIMEKFKPERITLSLAIEKEDHKGRKTQNAIGMHQQEIVIAYLTDHVSANSSEIGEILGVSTSRARAILMKLAEHDIVEFDTIHRRRIYRLKA